MSDFAALARRLTEHARQLAAARLVRRDPAQVWRRADLLWPAFTKGSQ